MNEEDIKKQLSEKNKEIYLNKLKLDIENNLEVLVLSIENALININNDTVNRILGIAESFQNKDIITQNVNNFIEKYHTFLIYLLDEKKVRLESLLTTKDINSYKEYFQNTNSKIKEELDNYFNDNIKNLIKNITNLYDEEFLNTRIKEYLSNNLKENINNKIIDIIKSRDIILLNTFRESYLKYQELNKNTIGI